MSQSTGGRYSYERWTEKELFKHLYELYGKHYVEIIAYKTHVYAFYNRLKKDYSDELGNISFEYIDLPLFLNDYLDLSEDEVLNESDFSDIILIFDFDPHDPQYDPDKLSDLLGNFSESTGRGMLYINYPMVESYKDITSLEDPLFILDFNLSFFVSLPIRRLESVKSSVVTELLNTFFNHFYFRSMIRQTCFKISTSISNCLFLFLRSINSCSSGPRLSFSLKDPDFLNCVIHLSNEDGVNSYYLTIC